MQESRNAQSCNNHDGRGTVCIDTKRILDSCRDRDCFEDTRVYLTSFGEEVLASSTNVRTKSAKTLWAYVGVNEVPFNNGFYQITVRYYILVEFEACIGIGRSQCFSGLATLEKDVILYGGEGSITSYSSSPDNNYCSIGNTNNVGTNLPVAVVEAVEPIVLGTKVSDCCSCSPCCECCELPEVVRGCIDGELVTNGNSPRIYVSFGLFSVIRIERPAQLLIQAADYCVPDKECCAMGNNDNPCDLFRTIAFPISRFKGSTTPHDHIEKPNGGCGCGKGN